MAYVSKNPKFDSVIIDDVGVGTPANPAAGSHKLVNRSGALYVRNSSGTETELLSGSAATLYSAKSASYTVLDNDNIRTIGMTTGGTDRTVTLPTAAANTNRILTIKKVDSGTGSVTIDPEGTETLDGSTSSFVMYNQNDYITIQCDGTGWVIIDNGIQVRYEVKTLGSSVAGNAADKTILEFTGVMIVGRTYRLSGRLQTQFSDGAALNAKYEILHNGAVVRTIEEYRETTTLTLQFSHNIDYIFVAASADIELRHNSSNASYNTAMALDGGVPTTFLQLEELPRHIVTTAF